MRVCMCVAAFASILALSGCNASKVVPEPGKITLENALRDVGTGLVAMHNQLKDANLKTGMLPTEVSVSFNISASATDKSNGKLYVEAGAEPVKSIAITKAGGEAGYSSEITAQRGNVITIKFQNLLSMDPEKTLAGKMDSAAIDKLFAVLGKHDIKTFILTPEVMKLSANEEAVLNATPAASAGTVK